MPSDLSRRITELSSYLTDSRYQRLTSVLNERTRYLTVILEDIYDPHNASACLRSCEACGVHEIHIVEKRNRFESIEGVTMGSARWLELHRHTANTETVPADSIVTTVSQEPILECYSKMSALQRTIVAMTPHPESDKSVDFQALPLDQPLTIVFGSEKDGLSKQALDAAQIHTRLPIHGFVESYNISVACALAVFHLRQRLSKEVDAGTWKLTESDRNKILYHWLQKSIRNVNEIERRLDSQE